ncbi:MAG: hypothetical protein HKM04_08380 [Legionellales bacterium]|nr:hypothetical protein [Legionellales bacterium]
MQIVFENQSDLTRKIMAPLSFCFYRKPPNGRINAVYYCENLFAVTAIKKNKALYSTLLNFISEEEKQSIIKKYFFSPSPLINIKVLKKAADIEKVDFLKNAKYMLLYPSNIDFSVQIQFVSTNEEGLPDHQLTYLVDQAWSYHLNEHFHLTKNNLLEELFFKIMTDFYQIYKNELLILVQHGYYIKRTVEKCFPAIELENVLENAAIFDNSDNINVVAGSLTMVTTTFEEKHGNNLFNFWRHGKEILIDKLDIGHKNRIKSMNNTFDENLQHTNSCSIGDPNL